MMDDSKIFNRRSLSFLFPLEHFKIKNNIFTEKQTFQFRCELCSNMNQIHWHSIRCLLAEECSGSNKFLAAFSLLSSIIWDISSLWKAQPVKSFSEKRDEGVVLQNARGTCFTLRVICNSTSCHQKIQGYEDQSLSTSF